MSKKTSTSFLSLFLLFLLQLPQLALSRGTSSPSDPYKWKSVIAGGGGFVPGIIYHPTVRGLAYARTDMGGAYRWDSDSGRWTPLTDMIDRDNSDYMGILSLALDPNDSDRVYMECGKYTQSWAGFGAVLSSTDMGDSWAIHPLTVKIGGNEDGRGTGERLQVDPNLGSVLFMGTTKDGLWKSTDYGSSWLKVSSFGATNVNFVLFDRSSDTLGSATRRIFVATNNTIGQSLYRSEDGGASWSVVSGQPTDVMAIRAQIADSILYVTFANSAGPNGATAGSVWKYFVGSGAWTNISPSNGSYGFSGISIYARDPRIMIVSTLDRWSPMDEVYRSTDGGASWTTRLAGAVWDRSYAPYTSSINPHWLAALAMDPFDSSKAMFGTGYGIWGSDNMESASPTWYFKDQNLEETVPMQIISPQFTSLLSAVGDIDGFRHDNLDVSPSDRFSPHKGTTLSIAFAGKLPSKIVKAFNTRPYGAYSTDGGTTWRDFGGRGSTGFPAGTTEGGSWTIAVSADGSSIVWAPTGASMSRSTDNGKTWLTCSGGVPTVPPIADRVNSENFYAYNGLDGTLWVSTNAGASFHKGGQSLPTVPSNQSQDGNAAAMPDHEGEIFVCCGTGGLYYSNDAGQTASKVNSVGAAYRVGFGRGVHSGDYPTLFLHGTVDGILGIYRSVDKGISWTRINEDNHQFGWIHQISGDPRVFGRCYISAEGRGILYGNTRDSSVSSTNPSSFKFSSILIDSVRTTMLTVTFRWSQAIDPENLPLTYAIHFFGPSIDTTFETADTNATFTVGGIRPSSIYVLTGEVTNGTGTTPSSNHLPFAAAATLTGIGKLPGGIPRTVTLGQNYPNPFNPSTTIAIDIPSSSNVVLKVYDLLGREVATLLNEKLTPSSYRVQWVAPQLSSGVYFYSLIINGRFTETRKMLITK